MSDHILPSDGKTEFAIKEWEKTREQVHLLLQAIWRFEAASILGLAAFYAWYFSTRDTGITFTKFFFGHDDNLEPGLEHDFLILVPIIFSFAIRHRLKIEYGILVRLGDYSKRIEDYVYRAQGNFTRLGWQTYLERCRPDDIKYEVIRSRFSNTFNLFRKVIIGTILIAIVDISIHYGPIILQHKPLILQFWQIAKNFFAETFISIERAWSSFDAALHSGRISD
ncbi:hypothetical protein [Aureimonas leprariae]|uniref:Uncharacterized protein n=1 Tax=Plantimonas leprariae TaxID=2615207 RepID=A0A7V7PNC0_9HYPH|nr:hypothetical protein [Aureimonas leprariae]KAB0679047.1 hypothetical protein F6X38_14215 [Aureimonas leprariae]